MPDKLGYKEAAARLGISVGALRNKVSAGEIECSKTGKRVFFDPAIIEDLLNKKKAIRFTVELTSDEVESLKSYMATMSEYVNSFSGDTTEARRLVDALDKVIDGANKAVKP